MIYFIAIYFMLLPFVRLFCNVNNSLFSISTIYFIVLGGGGGGGGGFVPGGEIPNFAFIFFLVLILVLNILTLIFFY